MLEVQNIHIFYLPEVTCKEAKANDLHPFSMKHKGRFSPSRWLKLLNYS